MDLYSDIDECASSPAQNGGTCTDGVNGYTSACVAGYTGTECETSKPALIQTLIENTPNYFKYIYQIICIHAKLLNDIRTSYISSFSQIYDVKLISLVHLAIHATVSVDTPGQTGKQVC